MPTRPHRPFARVLTAILSMLALGQTARAAITYTEPPDLSSNLNFPTPVGTVSAGLNTIHGTVSATYTNGGPSGDYADAASFIIPAGLVVTRVDVVITNFSVSGPIFAGARSFESELGNYVFGASGTSPNLIIAPSGVLAAGTYGLQVYSGATSGGNGSISYTWEFRITAAPATNDTCQLATPIGLGPTPFDTTSATTDGPAHSACIFSNGPSIGKDLWYSHTPALNGILTVNTCGSAFDTEVNVYNGNTSICPGADATLLACNDDSNACPNALQSQVVIPITAGQTCLIRVGGYDGGGPPLSGTGTLTLSALTTGACCNRWTGHCTVRGQLDCTSQGLRFDGFGSACSAAACKACPAEFNGNGVLEIADIFAFLNSWFAGCP